jgi:ubiquinone/menaquinone biosynthesis C-methylase UbiE
LEGLIQRDQKVIAVDRSQAMLSEMKQKFADIDLIDYRLGEASSLPIQDETVDYAFTNMYLHHVEVSLQAIIEMVRILKPGGRVVITDLDEHGYEFFEARA